MAPFLILFIPFLKLSRLCFPYLQNVVNQKSLQEIHVFNNIMDLILNEFQNLKISALNKAKLVNKDINEVTIGPNSVNSAPKHHIFIHRKNSNPKKDIQFNNKKIKDEQISIGKIMAEAEAERRDEVQVKTLKSNTIESIQNSIK